MKIKEKLFECLMFWMSENNTRKGDEWDVVNVWCFGEWKARWLMFWMFRKVWMDKENGSDVSNV